MTRVLNYAIVIVCLSVSSLSVAHATTGPERIVKAWLGAKDLRGLQVGVSVVEVSSGETLVGVDEEVPLFAASVTKVATTAAALRLLPASVNWRTEVLGELHHGEALSPLYLIGSGAPKLSLAQVETLADQLVKGGLKDAKRGLRLDRSRFGPSSLPPGFELKSTDAGYRPRIGALASNFGAVMVEVKPNPKGRGPVTVTVDGGADQLRVRSVARTRPGKARSLTLRMSRSVDGQSLLEISGEIGREAKPHRERKALVEPDLWTGRVLKAALMKRGVPVGPIAVTAQAIGSTQRVRSLAHVDDQGLSGTVKDINTWSNNFMAESLMLGLGCDVALPCQWQRASSRIEGFFDDLKVPKAERQIVNGSGLYLASKLSARAITHLLVFMADDQVFLDSLAVPGRPGTLSGRLRALGRGPRLRAKTGMLDEVVSLAGYLTTRGGKTLAFAVLVNGATPKRTHALKRRIDKLVSRLASSKAPR